MAENLQWKMDSKIGPLYLVASATGLRGVFWQRQSSPIVKDIDNSAAPVKILAMAVTQLSEYFDGLRKEFSVPLEIEGTEFQKKVWQQLCKIPFGKTKAYQDIAKDLANENASRAVGTANGKNPISIIIPCHRVIASDGTLGGYAGGLGVKKCLLELEQRA